jgi:hypothetical protein
LDKGEIRIAKEKPGFCLLGCKIVMNSRKRINQPRSIMGGKWIIRKWGCVAKKPGFFEKPGFWLNRNKNVIRNEIEKHSDMMHHSKNVEWKKVR